IRSYREAEVDTFAPVVSTLSKLHDLDEGGSIQVVVNPVGADTNKKSVLSAIDELKKGKKLKDVKNNSIFQTKDFQDIVFSGENGEQKEKVVDDEAIKALQAKLARPLFKVNVRLVASARSKADSESLLHSMSGAFSQFASPLRNGFKLIVPRNARSLIFQYVFREYDSAQSMILNTEEIASVFHFPTLTTDVPRIAWLVTEQAPPPSNLPEDGVVIGESIFRGESKPVRMTDSDRRRHLYVIGQTGTGKSYLMGNMAVQDMEDGKGLCMIDPHGTTIEALLERVPPHRIDDVIYFDPGDLRRPMGLNMLDYDVTKPEQKTFIVNEIQSIFNQLFDKETMGPMFEQYMRNSLLLLMGDITNEQATMTEIPRIFTDSEYRKAKIERCKDPMVVDFWTKEATKTTGETGLANMTPYITSKFGNFISNEYMRPIIGQPKSAFDFRQVMDSRKILLVNLAKGKIGDINSALLGMIFTGRLLMAALSRGDLAEEERSDFYLYIDEFQNYTTESIATILSEARKYRLDLILAHQYIAQLKDNIRESVFGNVGSMAAFRIGATDAETLVKQFGPEFTEKDLITVENRHAFAKMLINGEPARPFSFRT
ncbi:MAG: type IV secretory system conjugative DNA transfer family protein, partial [bacterium]